MINKKISLLIASTFVLSTLLTGCKAYKGDDDTIIIESATQDYVKDTGAENEKVLSGKQTNEKIYDEEKIEFLTFYEYYLTREELLADIENGYVFRMDKTFEEAASPTVTGGTWAFNVNEDNVLNLEIAFSNLFTEFGPDNDSTELFKVGKEISVSLISPDEETVYSFERKGSEITENTSIYEQIPITKGEWKLKLTFAYISRGEPTPSNLKIAAYYENPSEQDIEDLKDLRLK